MDKLPAVHPTSQCKLKLLKMERIKYHLLLEKEFVINQEHLKPKEEKAERERPEVEDWMGSPMGVGTLEKMIDEDYATVYPQLDLNTTSTFFHFLMKTSWSSVAVCFFITKC